MCEDTNHVFNSGSPEAAASALFERTKLVGMTNEFVIEKLCEAILESYDSEITARGIYTEDATLDTM